MRQSFWQQEKEKEWEVEFPKQYMLIKSRPLVYYALKAFEESAVDEVILVTGEDEIDYCKEYIVDRYHFNKVKKDRLKADGNVMHPFILDLKQSRMQIYVLIHDGARPMISAELVTKMHILCKKISCMCSWNAIERYD